jgi:hypothetical protein
LRQEPGQYGYWNITRETIESAGIDFENLLLGSRGARTDHAIDRSHKSARGTACSGALRDERLPWHYSRSPVME